MKTTLFSSVLALAALLSAHSAHAACTVEQNLINESQINVKSTLQFDGLTTGGLMEVYDDICSSNVQNFTNRGTLDVSSTLQFGGITAGVTTRVGSPD